MMFKSTLIVTILLSCVALCVYCIEHGRPLRGNRQKIRDNLDHNQSHGEVESLSPEHKQPDDRAEITHIGQPGRRKGRTHHRDHHRHHHRKTDDTVTPAPTGHIGGVFHGGIQKISEFGREAHDHISDFGDSIGSHFKNAKEKMNQEFSRIHKGLQDLPAFGERLIPSWVAPWMNGHISLENVNIDWDLGNFFQEEQSQWWEGPNVCIHNDEIVDSHNSTENAGHGIVRHHFQMHSSCEETETSYKCSSQLRFQDKIKTFVLTYECCLGFHRAHGQFGCPQKLELSDVMRTITELGSGAFAEGLGSVGLMEMVKSGNYTIFAPNDGTFRKYLPDSDIELNVVIVSPEMRETAEKTRETMLSHIVSGWHGTTRLTDEQELITENDRAKIRINFYETPKRMMTANCVPVMSSDHFATNGIVHQMQDVLLPVEETIYDIVTKDPQLQTLKTLLGQLGSKQLKHDGQLTLFAPTDAAFKKLKPPLLKKFLDGSPCLGDLIGNHLLPNVICSAIIEGQVKSKTRDGHYLNMSRNADGKLFVDGAQFVIRDKMATNGVVHIIDQVLVPDSALDVLDVAEKAGASQFLQYVSTSGLTAALQSMDNYTLFLPTNEAFESMSDELKHQVAVDPLAMARILRYHVVTSGEMQYHQLRNYQQLSTLENNKKILIKEYFSAPFGLKHVTTAQCSPVIAKNLDSCNGIAHMVDKLLLPPSGDVIQTLSEKSEFSMLVHLLKMTHLADELSEGGPYTLFAPTNTALEKLDSTILNGLKQDNLNLKKFLKNHIMRGTTCCTSVFQSNWFWKQREWTLAETFIRLSRSSDIVTLDDNVEVSACDITATNGIIHAIDKVIPEAWDRFAVKPSQQQHEDELRQRNSDNIHWDQPNVWEWGWDRMGLNWDNKK